MSWLRNIFNTRLNKNFQEENRNKAALQCLRALCYGQAEIVKALIDLNRIRIKDLAAKDGISAVTLYNTISGHRTNSKAMELIAASLAMTIGELFPDKAKAPEPHPERFEREPRTRTSEAPGQVP